MAGILVNGVETIKFMAPLTVSSNKPAFVSDSVSLKRFALELTGQRWEIKANIVPTNNSADFLVHSVINGKSQIIDVRMPQVYRLGVSSISANITVSSASAGSNTLSVSGNNGQPLPAGEFVRINDAGHTKVYMVVSDNGAGSITVFPNLLSAVSNKQLLYGNNVTMKARYDMDTILGMSFQDGILMSPGQISLIEAI